jgi:hypothetical protein
MHIENELVEYVTPDDQEYEEIVENYEKEVLVHEEFPEPPVTYTTDTAPAQGKLQCIALIFDNHNISICYAFTLQEILWKPHAYLYLPMSLTRADSSSALLRFIGSVSNLPLLTMGGYYY